MTLRGDLQSFSPSELLQFLGISKKTGLLKIYDDQESKFLSFREGNVVYAVHQRPLPHLSELLVRPGEESSGDTSDPSKPSGWDDIVNRALARRRLLPHQQSDQSRQAVRDLARESRARLKTLIIAQGKLSREKLGEALDPRTLPDYLVREVLKSQHSISEAELFETITTRRDEESIYECLTEQGLLTHAQFERAVQEAPDDLVAEILVARGVMSRAETRHCLGQLQSLQGQPSTQVRLGEYLVATGQVSQPQFERALVEQLDQDKRLGEIFIDQGIITPMEILKAIDEIEELRVDFGPLSPLRQKLSENHFIGTKDFSEAISHHSESGQDISTIFAETGKISSESFRDAAREVIVDEICDTLIWNHARFEFIEDLSLSDLLPSTEYAEVSRETFSVQQLLLDAHHQIDELRASERNGLSLLSVFIPTDLTNEKVSEQATSRSLRVLRNFDGQKSLRQVRRILPGNRYAHLRLFSDLLDEKLVRPLTRREAFLRAKNAAAKGEHAGAINLFRHALRMAGDVPSNSKLQAAIQTSKKTVSSSTLLGRWLERLGLSPSRAAIDDLHDDSPEVSRGRLAFEEALIRNSITRHFWALQNRIESLADQVLPRHITLPRSAGLAVALFVVAAVGLTVHTLQRQPASAVAAARGPGVSLRTGVLETGSPIEVAPLIRDDRVYVTSRDGFFRAFDLGAFLEGQERTAQKGWEVQVGRFGDLLSSPVPLDEGFLVTSVHGELIAISSTGKIDWRKSLPRLERFPPILLPAPEGQSPRTVIAGRKGLHVLSTRDGAEITRLELDSTPSAPLAFHDSRVLFATRSGDVTAWEPDTNRVSWRSVFEGEPRELRVRPPVVLVSSGESRVSAFSLRDGQRIWFRDGLELFPAPSVSLAGGLIQGIEHDRRLINLEPETGNPVQTAPIDPLLSLQQPFPSAGGFLFGTERGFLGRLSAKGEVTWRSATPRGSVTGWATSDRVSVAATREGSLIFIQTP